MDAGPPLPTHKIDAPESNVTRHFAIAIAASLLMTSSPALAKDYDPVLPAAPLELSSSDMPLEVVLDQDVIATNVDIGRVAPSVNGGGLIGAIILAGKDRERKREHVALAEERAEANAAPIRNALAGFDVHALAHEAVRAAFASANILDASDEELASPPSVIAFSYGLSPDFTQVRVSADIAIVPWGDEKAVLAQRVTSIVELRQRSYDDDDNAERWAADDAARAKAALEKAFARLGTVMPQLAAMDAGKFSSLTDRKKRKSFAAGFYGPVLLSDEASEVIWTDHGAITSQQL